MTTFPHMLTNVLLNKIGILYVYMSIHALKKDTIDTIKKKIMKKSITTLAALVLTISIISCGNSQASDKGTEESGDGTEKNTDDKQNSDASEGGKSIHLTKAEFLKKVFDFEKNAEEWKFEGDIPCIVDFYADWCPPCKIAGPILDELAAEYEGKIHVYKVNTDKEKELAAAFGVTSIPTFMLCTNEGQPQIFAGIGETEEATKEMFKKYIDDVLLKTKTVQ